MSFHQISNIIEALPEGRNRLTLVIRGPSQRFDYYCRGDILHVATSGALLAGRFYQVLQVTDWTKCSDANTQIGQAHTIGLLVKEI